MVKRLIVVRHAKSSWDDPSLPDHDRPLSRRGTKASVVLGHWLLDNGYLPGEIVSSTAGRCKQSCLHIAAILGTDPELVWNRNLYLANAETLLSVVKTARRSVVMLLAHNPGIGEFARRILGGILPDHEKFDQYPTGATTVCDVDIGSWALLDWGAGRCHSFVVPRDLVS